MMDCFDFVLNITKENRERVFLVDTIGNREITFGEMYESGCRVASALSALGLKKGDRVACLLCNSAEFATLYFGCFYGGYVAVPINPILSAAEIKFILENSCAKLLFVGSDTIERVDLQHAKESGIKPLLLEQKHQVLGTSNSLELFSIEKSLGAPCIPFENVDPNDTMTIVYTSGTTARPNGVVHRYSDMIGNARIFNARVGIDGTNRFYNLLAMSYLGGYYNLLMLPFFGESQVVLGPTFNASSAINFWKPIIENKVNTLWVVPTIISMILELDRGMEGEEYCRNKIKLALVGTAPLAIEMRKSFERRYSVALFENYGLSETFFISTNSPASPVMDGSVGTLLPGVQVSVRDSNGQALTHGSEGELFVSTPHLMEGYYDSNTGEPNRLDVNAWFPTGDVGVLAPTGELYITGRRKDLIIRGGINVSPAAIENVVYSHESVAECAAVGVPHSIKGEDIVVVVRLKEGADFTTVESGLQKLFTKQLGDNSRPSRILALAEFPHSSSGKIQKVKIRQMLIEKLNLAHLPQAPGRQGLTKAKLPSTIPGRIRRNILRTSPETLGKLAAYPVSILSDVLNRMRAMSSELIPLTNKTNFCGNAITIEEIDGGNLMSHAALEFAEPGDVLVIDAKAIRTRSAWGGIQTRAASKRGVVGIVINGTVRDIEDFEQFQIPIFALGVSPAGPHKGWSGNVNLPIACGGVVVNPGDVVVGGRDGIVVVPREMVDEVATICERRLEIEKGWVERVDSGELTLDVVDLRKKLEELGVVYE